MALMVIVTISTNASLIAKCNPEELISVSTLFNPKYEESGVIFLIRVPIWLKKILCIYGIPEN